MVLFRNQKVMHPNKLRMPRLCIISCLPRREMQAMFLGSNEWCSSKAEPSTSRTPHAQQTIMMSLL